VTITRFLEWQVWLCAHCHV